MPINDAAATTCGDAVAAFIEAHKPEPGTPVSEDQLKLLWEGIVKIIYASIRANAELTVPALGLVDGQSLPCTGASTTGQVS